MSGSNSKAPELNKLQIEGDILNDSGLCGKEFHGHFIMGD